MTTMEKVVYCGVWQCRDEWHVPCAICGHPVCLGGLSDYQRERVVWRAKAERRPITHHDCHAQERRAA